MTESAFSNHVVEGPAAITWSPDPHHSIGAVLDLVIGAGNKADIVAGARDQFELDRQLFRQPLVVVVQERDDVAGDMRQGGIPGGGNAAMGDVSKYFTRTSPIAAITSAVLSCEPSSTTITSTSAIV